MNKGHWLGSCNAAPGTQAYLHQISRISNTHALPLSFELSKREKTNKQTNKKKTMIFLQQSYY